MITGQVNADYEAIVVVNLQGRRRETRRLEAVFDTGFSGFLTVPPAIVAELALPFLLIGRAILADGSEPRFLVHSTVVLWDDQSVTDDVEAADTTPLVGMRLLERYRLCAEAHDGGGVTIQPCADSPSRLVPIGQRYRLRPCLRRSSAPSSPPSGDKAPVASELLRRLTSMTSAVGIIWYTCRR